MTIYTLPELTVQKSIPEGAVAALGFFDGVHAGHQIIIERARNVARERGTEVGVWMIAAGDDSYKRGAPLLTSVTEKARLLSQAGATFAAVSPFGEIRDLDGEAFVKQILHGVLRLSCVVCGFNFRFGRGASMDAFDLTRLCAEAGISTIVTPPITTAGGEGISPTRIRRAIAEGDLETATEMLGRPYSFTLPVLHGKKLGRRLGFPTANQKIPSTIPFPSVGVYAAAVKIDGEDRLYPGAANIGHCPTVADGQANAEGVATELNAVCETYILGYSGDLYGREITVSLLRRLRGEIKFDGIDALTAQIRRDAEVAEIIFNKKYLLGKL